jgi:hypothetical protein
LKREKEKGKRKKKKEKERLVNYNAFSRFLIV